MSENIILAQKLEDAREAYERAHDHLSDLAKEILSKFDSSVDSNGVIRRYRIAKGILKDRIFEETIRPKPQEGSDE